MSPMQRREFLGAAGLAAATTAALLRPNRAEAGDPTFMNNVPDPLVSGKELPTFKFALEKSKGKVIGNSFWKEATVEQLPISKGIAGVSMKLEPGAMHIMLQGLKEPLQAGKSFPLTLTFEKAGQREIEVAVEKAGAMGPEGHAGMQMPMPGHR